MRFENDKLRVRVTALEKYKRFSAGSGRVVGEESLLLSSSWDRVERFSANLAIHNNVMQLTYQP